MESFFARFRWNLSTLRTSPLSRKHMRVSLATSNVFTIATVGIVHWVTKALIPMSRNTCICVLEPVSTFSGEDQLSIANLLD